MYIFLPLRLFQSRWSFMSFMLCDKVSLKTTRTRTFKIRDKMSHYQGRLFLLLILWHFGYVHGENNLWCYGCNTNLTKGRSQECNDPYAPGPILDLIQCPKGDSHQCLKSIIVYKSIQTTVRGCVPSVKVESYCDFKDYGDIFPGAKVECHFCSNYACNRSNLPSQNSFTVLSIVSVLLWKFFQFL